MVVQAWRQLYLFMSKPSRSPLQTGSGKGPYGSCTSGTADSMVSNAGWVSFASGADGVMIDKSWIGGKVSARVTEGRNRLIQPMYNIDQIILSSVECR